MVYDDLFLFPVIINLNLSHPNFCCDEAASVCIKSFFSSVV